MPSRTINKAGLDLIKFFEGCRLTAYVCPAGVLTIGFGSTGKHVKPGMRVTPAEAERLLKTDLQRFEQAVSAAVKVRLTDNQFAACVSLAFNIGTGAFTGSTLVKKLNASDFEGAAGQFERWNKAGGRVLAGLTGRRMAERDLFLTADPAKPTKSVPAVSPAPAKRSFLQRLFRARR